MAARAIERCARVPRTALVIVEPTVERLRYCHRPMKTSPRRQRASSHPRGEVLKRSTGVAAQFSEFSPFILVIKHTSWGGVNRYCDTKSSALS